jgi:hypothetical protein
MSVFRIPWKNKDRSPLGLTSKDPSNRVDGRGYLLSPSDISPKTRREQHDISPETRREQPTPSDISHENRFEIVNIARRIFNGSANSRGGQMIDAYHDLLTYLSGIFEKGTAIALSKNVVRDFAINETFTPIRKDSSSVITSSELKKIRHEAAKMIRSLECYYADPCFCEYVIKVLDVTQHNDSLTQCVQKCPVQDSRGGHSLGCGGLSLPGFEKDMCTVCSVRNLQTFDRPIVSNIIFGQYTENQSVSNLRARCPILCDVFDRCPECTP